MFVACQDIITLLFSIHHRVAAVKWITISPPTSPSPPLPRAHKSQLHAKPELLWMLEGARNENKKGKQESDCSNIKPSPLSAHPSMEIYASRATLFRVHNTLPLTTSHQKFFPFQLHSNWFFIVERKGLRVAILSVASVLNGNFLVSPLECVLVSSSSAL